MKGTGSRGSSFDSFVGSSVHACTKFSLLAGLGQMHLRRMNVQLRQLLKRARASLCISLFPHYGMRKAANRILGRRTCLSAVRVPSRLSSTKQRLCMHLHLLESRRRWEATANRFFLPPLLSQFASEFRVALQLGGLRRCT